MAGGGRGSKNNGGNAQLNNGQSSASSTEDSLDIRQEIAKISGIESKLDKLIEQIINENKKFEPLNEKIYDLKSQLTDIKKAQECLDTRIKVLEDNNRTTVNSTPNSKVSDIDKKLNLRLAIIRDEKKKLIRGVRCESDSDKNNFMNLFGTENLAPDIAFLFNEYNRPSVRFKYHSQFSKQTSRRWIRI